MDEPIDARRGLPGAWLGVPLAAAAAVAALCASGALPELPRALRAGCAALTLGFGLGSPLVLGRGGRRAGALESALAAMLLSLSLALVGFLALRGFAGLGAERAAAVVLWTAVPLQAMGLRARLPRVRADASLWALVPVALFIAFAVVAGSGGSALRVSHHGLLHSALAEATERALPPSNPWMADAALAYYWVWHALASCVGRAAGVAPTVAFALLGSWAAAASGLALWSLARATFASALARFLAVTFGLFGLNALGGYYSLLSGFDGVPPATAGELLATLRGRLLWGPDAAPTFDPRVVFGPSKFANPSSYPAALGFGLGGLAAGARALQRAPGDGAANAPWTVVAALALAASVAINPLVGAPLWACVLGVTLLARPLGLRRTWLGPLLVAGVVPGLWLVAGLSSEYGGAALAFGATAERTGAALWPLALLLPLALAAPWAQRVAEERPGPGRAGLWLCVLLATGGIVGAALVRLPYANEYKFVRLAAIGAGLLAGGGAQALIARGGLARAAGATLCTAALVGAGLAAAVGVRAVWSVAGHDLPVIEGAHGLLPRSGGALASERAALYELLRASPAVRAANPVLVLDIDAAAAPRYGEAPGFAFVDAINLQGHEAPAFAGLDLFVDRPSQVLAESQPPRRARYEFLGRVLRRRDALPAADFARFHDLGRPLLFAISALERRSLPALPARLRELGFDHAGAIGGTHLFALPAAFADELRAELERASSTTLHTTPATTPATEDGER